MTESLRKLVLTGHSCGLGAAIAEAVLAQGIAVLGISRSTPQALEARYPDLLQHYSLDLADTSALADWLDSGVLDRFLANASQCFLINNAGIVQPVGSVGRQGARAIAKAIGVNVAAPLMLTDAFVRATTQARDRRVLHISSGAARSAIAGWSVYCATKAALDHHARVVVTDEVTGLRMVSLAPGVIDTDMQAAIRATPFEQFPLRDRFQTMKDEGALASSDMTARELVAYLMSETFGQITDADLRML